MKGPAKESLKIQIQCLSFAVINHSMIPKHKRFQTQHVTKLKEIDGRWIPFN